MAGGDVSNELRRTWESAAPGWAKWEAVFAQGLADATDTMLDMAGVDAGMHVLDLACGAGNQTLRAAGRVGPQGRVVASDLSATMLAYVREAASHKGLGHIETLECAAENLPSGAGPFDAAISRLGLMLFPAPERALMAVQRVLKPKARLAVLVFTTPSANPFMAKPMQILLRHAGKAPPAAGKPGIFALGAPRVLQDLLSSSGLMEVETRVVKAPLRLASAAQTLEMMQQAFGAYRAVVADLDHEARAAAWSEVGEYLRPVRGPRGLPYRARIHDRSGRQGRLTRTAAVADIGPRAKSDIGWATRSAPTSSSPTRWSRTCAPGSRKATQPTTSTTPCRRRWPKTSPARSPRPPTETRRRKCRPSRLSFSDSSIFVAHSVFDGPWDPGNPRAATQAEALDSQGRVDHPKKGLIRIG